MKYFLVIFCLFTTQQLFAGGGWIREKGSGYVKLGGTTLTAKTYYEADGSKSDRFGTISTQTAFVYGEFGIAEDVEAILNIPFFKQNGSSIFNTVSGIGDVGVGVRIPIQKGEWPISAGILLELPTGCSELFSTPSGDGIVNGVVENMPTGDGELNGWVHASISRSFYPFPGFATFSAGYNFRSLAVTEYTSTFDGGNLTNTYFIELEGGVEPWTDVWFNARFRRFAPAGTPQAGRYSFFGLGEGVEYNAWFVGAMYKFGGGFGASVDYSSAFGVRSIYAGANIVVGVQYEWK